MVCNSINSHSHGYRIGKRLVVCALVILGFSLPQTVCAQVQIQGDLVPFRPGGSNERPDQKITHQSGFLSQIPAETTPQKSLPAKSSSAFVDQDDVRPVFSFEGGSNGTQNSPSLGSQINNYIQSQQTDPRFTPSQTQGGQPAYPVYRPQDARSVRSQEPVEALPDPLVDAADDGESVIVQRYADGRPKIIRHVAQDEGGNYYNHGPWEVRNQAGQIIAKGSYDRGLMDGQWSRKHQAGSSGLFATKPFNMFQGPFESVAVFKQGKLNGHWTIYDQRQTEIFEIPYQDGVRDGTATWFYPNGAKMREATFRQGLIDGEILDYNEAEKVAGRQVYVEGRKIVRNTTFYRPNVKKSEDYFLAAKLEPQDADDWWEANPTPYRPTGNETQDGASMSWYENGQPKKRGQYNGGKPVGQFTWWHADGNKQIEGFYVDGKKSRRWTWWFENGMKQFEGSFEDDQPVHVWRSWYADGELRKEKDYSPEPESTVAEKTQEPASETQNVIETAANEPKNTEPDPNNAEANSGSGDLPAPKKTNADGQAEEMEDITPLEFRTPKTPGDAGADDDEVGTIELIEGRTVPNNSSGSDSSSGNDK